MKLFRWDAESHNFLSSETRIQQFDFERVAKAVRIRYDHLSCEVTPDECRLAYADEFSEKFLPDMLSETSGLSIDDSMTFDEVMNVVERRKERSDLRKKKTFERILASLGPIVMSSNTESVELDMIKSNIAVKRMKEQNEQSKRKEIATKRNEAARLENEREILRKRSIIPACEFRDEGLLKDTVMPLYLDAESDLKFPDAVEADLECSDSVTDDDKDHADLVLGDDLDAVLEEVEKELDLQAGDKGQTRGVEVRSELYEVLALLERASVSKEREGELLNKMQQSITIAADILKPPRTTSSRAAAVPAHESSVLLDNRDDSILTADIEAELTPPPPTCPLEETVLEIGNEGLLAKPPVKDKNKDEAQSLLSCDDPTKVCAPSFRAPNKMQSGKEVECEEVRDDHSECGSVDSQGSDDWVDSRSSLKMKALLYRSCPVPLPPSVPGHTPSSSSPSSSSTSSSPSSSEADAMCATVTHTVPENGIEPATTPTIPTATATTPLTSNTFTTSTTPPTTITSSTTTPPTSTADDEADKIQIISQSHDRHSSDVAQATSTPLNTISAEKDIHQTTHEGSDTSLAYGQQSCLVAPALIPITQSSASTHTAVHMNNGMDLKGGGSASERFSQVRESGSLLSSRSGPRTVAAPRILRPAG